MNMSKETRTNIGAGRPRPVSKIELDSKNIGVRIIFVALFLVMGAFAFGSALNSLLGANSGWNTIEAKCTGPNCSDDFVFKYNLGSSGGDALAERRALTSLYSDACQKAYDMLNVDADSEGNANLFRINSHPNEELEVDKDLYAMLKKVQNSKSRYIYLAPVYEYYDNIFYCNDDTLAKEFDGAYNGYVANENYELAQFASSEQMVDIKLLDDNKVMLFVASEYLEYAKEHGVTNFIDFYWMKNAFIIDYLADTIYEAGYNRGIITSFEGFVRNIDDSGEAFSLNIYDKEDGYVKVSDVYEYFGPQSIVLIKSFLINPSDSKYWYEYADGTMRSPYISIADGSNKCRVENLVACSDLGCGDIVLRIAPMVIEGETVDLENITIVSEE